MVVAVVANNVHHGFVHEPLWWLWETRTLDSWTGRESSTFVQHLLQMILTMAEVTVQARELERDRPPTPNHDKKEHQHKSSYIHVPV